MVVTVLLIGKDAINPINYIEKREVAVFSLLLKESSMLNHILFKKIVQLINKNLSPIKAPFRTIVIS